MQQSSAFKGKLTQIVKFAPNSIVDINILHPKCKTMLIKPAKASVKLVNWIINKQYVKWNVQQFLKNVQEAKVYKFEARKNYQKDIIRHILHVRWSSLRYLNLEENWIVSVEMLAYLDAPELRWVNLKHNEIVHFSALRKCLFPKLRTLKLDTNEYLPIFNEIGNYSRHCYVIGRQILRNHSESVFSERIKSILSQRKHLFPLKSNKKDYEADSDESESD